MSLRALYTAGLIVAAVLVVVALGLFVGAVWTQGDPHDLSGKLGNTGVIAMMVGLIVGGCSLSLRDKEEKER